MIIRWFGAFCIVAGSGCIGLVYNLQQRSNIRILEQLTDVIRYMEQDLRYRQLPLPDLLQNAMCQCDGVTLKVLTAYYHMLHRQATVDTEEGMKKILAEYQGISAQVREGFIKFARCIGQFDIAGQLITFANIREELTEAIKHMTKDHAAKKRSRQTLALCAGAAIAILLI